MVDFLKDYDPAVEVMSEETMVCDRLESLIRRVQSEYPAMRRIKHVHDNFATWNVVLGQKVTDYLRFEIDLKFDDNQDLLKLSLCLNGRLIMRPQWFMLCDSFAEAEKFIANSEWDPGQREPEPLIEHVSNLGFYVKMFVWEIDGDIGVTLRKELITKTKT